MTAPRRKIADTRRDFVRIGLARYLYRGFAIQRFGRFYTVERFRCEHTMGADSFDRLWKARDHVDWLASIKRAAP